jgi:hypothetical protein
MELCVLIRCFWLHSPSNKTSVLMLGICSNKTSVLMLGICRDLTEAVSSVIYAGRRISDVPELAELSKLFATK